MVADVDHPPGAHPVALRVGAAQHPGLERRLLSRRQPLRPTRAGPVVQTLHSFGIVAQHGVPERLPLHPGQPCGFRPRQALERVGDGQETHRGPAIRLGAGETTQRRGGQVLTDGKSRHGAVLQPPRHLALLHPIHKFKLLWAGIRWQIGSFFELVFLVLLFGPDRVAGWI
jgi:hypothetical protein